MNNRSIFLKSVICVFICIVMSLSIIFINIMGFDFYYIFILGGFCGIVIAIVTKSDTLKRTIIAKFTGLFSAVITQFLLLTSDIPYYIIKLFYRGHNLYGEENWFRDLEHLIENEVSIYNFSAIYFLYSLLASFCTTVVVIFITVIIKNHRKST